MPSEHQAGTTTERPEYPDLREEYGEDPARYLYRGSVREETGDDDYGTSSIGGSPLLLAAARIRGIEDVDLAHAWRRVEYEITDGEPRTRVLSMIEDRIEYLEACEEQPPSGEPTTARAAVSPEAVMGLVAAVILLGYGLAIAFAAGVVP